MYRRENLFCKRIKRVFDEVQGHLATHQKTRTRSADSRAVVILASVIGFVMRPGAYRVGVSAVVSMENSVCHSVIVGRYFSRISASTTSLVSSAKRSGERPTRISIRSCPSLWEPKPTAIRRASTALWLFVGSVFISSTILGDGLSMRLKGSVQRYEAITCRNDV